MFQEATADLYLTSLSGETLTHPFFLIASCFTAKPSTVAAEPLASTPRPAEVWISPDPARQFNSPYAYSPNPINSIDPDGNASVGVGATFSGNYGPAGAHISLGVTFDTDALARGDFGNVLFVDGAVGVGARIGVGASGRVRLSYSPDAPEVGRSQLMSREVIAGKGVVIGVKESFDMKSRSDNRSLEISAGLGEEWAGGLTAEVKDTKTFGSFLREFFTGKNDERLK